MKNKKIFWILLFFSFLYLFRIINISADLPAWGVINYQPVDEGLYGNMALNMVNFGNLDPNVFFGKDVYFMQGHVINDIIGNIFVYIGLILLGDNYLGFRFPIVFVSLISFLLLLLSFNKIKTNEKRIFLPVLVILTSFQIYVFSRVVEPSVFRMFFICLILYTMISDTLSVKRKAFLVGFLITISCFLVYITNVFLYLSCFFYIIYLLFFEKEKKEAFTYTVYGIIGILVGLIVSQAYYLICWNTDIITNTVSQINSFQYDSTYATDSYTSMVIIHRLISFISSNMFLYSLPILAYLLCNSYKLIHNKKDKKIIHFCLFIVLSFVLQTIISEDYVIRKSVVIFPVYMMLFYFTIIGENTKDISMFKIACTFISLLLIIGIPLYRLYFNSDGSYYDFGINDKRLLLLSVIVSLIYVLFSVFQRGFRFNKYSVLCIVVLFSIINSALIFKHCFKNVTFTEKNAMIEMSEFNGQVITGEYVNGYTLYNDVKPLLNTFDELREIMQEEDICLYFDYADLLELEKDRFKTDNVQLIKELKRNFYTFGNSRNMGVYEITWEKE